MIECKTKPVFIIQKKRKVLNVINNEEAKERKNKGMRSSASASIIEKEREIKMYFLNSDF